MQQACENNNATSLYNLQVIASGVSGDTITDRPYAPLSGDKLRIHSFYEPKKVMCDSGGAAASTGPVSSAEALDRLSNSGAAAVRKIAAQELREVHDKRTLHGTHSTHSDSVQRVRGQAKGKGGVPHYTAKALKRAHHQISPRPTHLSSQTQQQGAHHHHHLAYSQVHNNQLAVSERVVVGPVGGVRSQSAGVNLSCEGGGNAHSNRKDARQKLPPVLRGMLRGGASSSSGNIGSIDEGHALPAGADSGCDHAVGAVPMMLLDPSASPVSRYIQSAPAVSRSLNLPPIEGTHRHGLGQVHRQGGSIDNFTSSNSSGSGGQEDGGGGAMLTSHTPTAKQPRQHRFGRPTVPSGVSEILQQSFANAMKGYSHDQKGAHE